MSTPITNRAFVKDEITGKIFEISVVNGALKEKEHIEIPAVKTPLEEAIDVESDIYRKRLKDGQDAVRNMMSELRLNSQANNYPRSVNKAIEDAFKGVSDALSIYGWWVTAKEELDEIVVSEVVTQEFWDRINLVITTYIAENY